MPDITTISAVQALTFGDKASGNIPNAFDSFTAMIFVKPLAIGDAKIYQITNRCGLGFDSTGNPSFIAFNDPATPINYGFNSAALAVGTWKHLTVAFDNTGGAGNLSLYVNGVLARALGGRTLPTITTQDSFIGLGPAIAGQIGSPQAILSEARFYNRGLTASEIGAQWSGLADHIVATTDSAANLALAYPCNEGTGTTLHDQTASPDQFAPQVHFNFTGGLSWVLGSANTPPAVYSTNTQQVVTTSSYAAPAPPPGGTLQPNLNDQFIQASLRQGCTGSIDIVAQLNNGATLDMTGKTAKLIMRHSTLRDATPKIIEKTMHNAGSINGQISFEFELVDTNNLPVGTWQTEIVLSQDNYMLDIRCAAHGTVQVLPSLLGA